MNKFYSILTLIDFYLPGYKAGGPIRTLSNMVDRLGKEFHFKIITRDRDLEESKPYSGIEAVSWQKVGNAEAYYLCPQNLSLRALRRVIYVTGYDVLYLNSFFSPNFTLKPLLLRRLGLISKAPIIVAPRGEFSLGALGIKPMKKRAYIVLSKLIGLYRGVIWQASGEHEKKAIRRYFGDYVPVVVAQDLPPIVCHEKKESIRREKAAGYLKIVFLSRISRMKNLDGALRMLKQLKGKVEFNIYGPMEDKTYWAKCQKIIGGLPKNIEVQYRGSVMHNNVASLMGEHDLFFLPTLGENFGHVILEAFCAGCPVLISDQTLWLDLERKGVGWDLPLGKPEQFRNVLQKCLDMDNSEHKKWSEGALSYGFKISESDEVVERNRRLFYDAVGVMCKNGQEQLNV